MAAQDDINAAADAMTSAAANLETAVPLIQAALENPTAVDTSALGPAVSALNTQVQAVAGLVPAPAPPPAGG